MFAIGTAGWLRLGATALAVGLVIRAANLNPFSAGFNVPDALGAIVSAVVGMFAWALANGWAPFLVGALVVMPAFVLWRLIAMPFRDKPIQPPDDTRHGARWRR